MIDHPSLGRMVGGWFLAGTVLAGVGCVRRTIEISSTPPDALVWVNSREVGRTPVTFEFTFDGVYDVRLRRDGYAPLVTSASTDPPLWDLPGIDFLAEITPLEFKRTVHWHFDLEPIEIDPAARIERANHLRAQLEKWGQRTALGSAWRGGVLERGGLHRSTFAVWPSCTPTGYFSRRVTGETS